MKPCFLYTLTPNPALDLSGHVRRLVPNEKNYVFRERRDPGGNAINAARIATRLGQKALALGFLGGAAGGEVQEMLDAEGVRTRFTPIREDTRISVTVTNDADHQQTRLTFPGPRITRGEILSLYRELRNLKAPGILVSGGSVPPGCTEEFYATVGQIAAGRGLGVIIDAPAKFLRELLKNPGFLPLLIKPNETELEEWYGKRLPDDRALFRAARAMSRKSAMVCLSLGPRGALLVVQDQAWLAQAPKIRAHGTVGAGDSMVGAMTAFLARNRLSSPERVSAELERKPETFVEMLSWGVAAGAATAEALGTAQAKPSEIRRLIQRVRVRRIKIS